MAAETGPIPARKRRSAAVLAGSVSNSKCCETENCVRHFSSSVVSEVRDCFSGNRRRQKLLDYFSQHQPISSDGNYLLLLRNVRVCATAFCLITGIPRSTFFNIKRAHEVLGERSAIHGNAGCVRDTTKKNAVLTNIPNSRFHYSALSGTQKLQYHVLGSIIFGQSVYFFLDIMDYPHDSNLNLTAVLETLVRCSSLPGSLHIQLDNTCRENKNQYVFAFLALLVERRAFEKITVGFLMKGHTHAQIDQAFSRLSAHINGLQRGVLTPSQFYKAIKSCYVAKGDSGTPQPIRLRKIYAIREWLLPHMDKFCNLRAFHNFELTLADNGRCMMRFKQWAWTEWQTADFAMLKSRPTGRPLLVKPNYANVDLQKLQQGIEQLFTVGGLTVGEKAEWQKFIQSETASDADWTQKTKTIPPGSETGTLEYVEDEADSWLLDELLAPRNEPDSTQEATLHPALLKAREEMETEAAPIMPVRQRAKWKRQREEEQATPTQDIKEGTVVAMRPDLEQCVESGRDPATFPWLAKAEESVSAAGTFSARWYESPVPGKFILTHNSDTLHVGAVLLWKVRLLSTGKLSETCQLELLDAMKPFSAEYEHMSDDVPLSNLSQL